jgi:parallel beta-helix repeat protein
MKKVILTATVSVLLVGLLASALGSRASGMRSSEITVPDDYQTIQEAINNAMDWGTVYVRSGVYYETVVVNKTVALVGEDRRTTIVDGNETGHVIFVTENNVNITGFTVQGSDPIRVQDVYAGIHLYRVDYCNISGNILTNNSAGIMLSYSDSNIMARNNLTRNWGAIGLTWDCNYNTILENNATGSEEWASIYVDMSEYNTISHNHIYGNTARGIFLRRAMNNIISENNITTNNPCGISVEENSQFNSILENYIIENNCGIKVLYSSDNIFYHNNFINNTVQTNVTTDYANTWNDDDPSGGNYWSDYNGTDHYSGVMQNITGSDGIGDEPYIIDDANIDRYPLMEPWIP